MRLVATSMCDDLPATSGTLVELVCFIFCFWIVLGGGVERLTVTTYYTHCCRTFDVKLPGVFEKWFEAVAVSTYYTIHIVVNFYLVCLRSGLKQCQCQLTIHIVVNLTFDVKLPVCV